MMQKLTFRENQICELLAQGHTDKEIADRLPISIGTVRVYVTNVYQKMGITNSWGNPRVRLAVMITSKPG